MPRALANFSQLFISQKRIKDYLAQPEKPLIEGERFAEPGRDARGDVMINNASYSWSADETTRPALDNITLRAAHGELVAIVGSVGSGKSSLLLAALGELHKRTGSQYVKGSVAYCAQQAWILAGTVRENVIFGRPYNDAKFRAAIEASGLQADLDQLPAAEFTEIGERGVNVSGGQKQRISLGQRLTLSP